MKKVIYSFYNFLIISIFIVAPLSAVGQTPKLVNTQPTRHSTNAPRAGAITLLFNQPIAAISANSLRVYGNQLRGLRPGTLSGGNSSTLIFTPTQHFAPGERVSVSLPATLINTAGVGIQRHVYEFTAATAGTGRGFFLDTTEVAATNSRDQLLGDLDNDGDLDLLTSAGLYGMFSYLNDGRGHFRAHYNSVVGSTPSGATLADIDQDGYLDLLAGDADNATVAIGLSDSAGGFGFVKQLVVVGNHPVSVAAGDVDGDGDMDFVSANYADNTITVGYNGGTALLFRIARTATFRVGQQPTAVQLADVDNDGDLDVLTSDSGSNTVSIRINSGAGTFSGTTSIAVGAAPADLRLADLDSDGDLDLVTVNAADGTVSVRLNNGLGGYSQTATLLLPLGSTPNSLQTGDVDADGDLDLVVAQGRGGQVMTFLNKGAANFAAQYGALELSSLFGSPVALGVTLGDVDGDGDLDLITADEKRGKVVLGRNGLAPSIGPPMLNAFSPAAGPVGTSVQISGNDLSSTTHLLFNGVDATFLVNSNQQITAVVPAGASTGALRLTTVGGSVESTQPFVVTTGPVPSVPVTGTIPVRNALGVETTAPVEASFAGPITELSAHNMAVIGSQRRGRQMGIVTGGGTATLRTTPEPAFAPGERVTLILPATLTSTSGGAVQPQVVEFQTATAGTGEGVFDASDKANTASATAPSFVRVADLDNDGDLDLISSPVGAETGAVMLHFNEGNGTFSPATSSSLPAFVGTPGEVIPADVDGDGDFDLLVAENYSFTSLITRINVWLNNGQGRFTAGSSLIIPSTSVNALRVGDMDADGDLDIVFIMAFDTVYVALNNGSGYFSLTSSTIGPNSSQLDLLDFDKDGDLDVLVTSYNYPEKKLVIALNDGRGQLTAQSPVQITLPQNLQDLAVGDITGDDIADLIYISGISTQQPSELAFWPGLGNGQFGARSIAYATSAYARSVRLADVNADGKLDVVTLSSGGMSGYTPLPPAELQVLLGDGRGGLGLPTTQTLTAKGESALSPELGDVDGDGDLDIVVANTAANALQVHFNRGRPVPTLATFAPAQGPIGTQIILTGTNFTSIREVRFAGKETTQVQVLSPTQCAVVIPEGARTGLITVGTPSGTATSVSSFTVTVPAAVTEFTPARNAINVPVNSAVSLRFAQNMPLESAGNIIVQGELRQGRRTGIMSGAGSSERRFVPNVEFAPGERVQVTLPVSGTPATGVAQPQGYTFTAATSGPGRGNLRWASSTTDHYNQYNTVTGDFNEDGAPDIIIPNIFKNRLDVLLNDKQGTLTTQTMSVPAASIFTTQVSDLNGDGHLDLVLTEYVTRRNNRQIDRIVWQAGTGTGAFGPVQPLHTLSGSPSEIVIGDVNGDGLPDLMAVIGSPDSVFISLNKGNGNFQRQPDILAAPYTNMLRLGDYNNDGILDMFMVSNGSARLYRYQGVGNGTFVPLPPLLLNNRGQGIAIELGDIDADGNLDIITSSGAVYVYRGDGKGNLSAPQILEGTGRFDHLRLADFDADGDLDLLTGSRDAFKGVKLFYNDGTGQFKRYATAGDNTVPRSVTVADFNLDGSLDMVVTGDSIYNLGNSYPNKSGLFTYFNHPTGPSIISFSPTNGEAGTVVTLTGTGLGSVISVTVGGVAVPFIVQSDTQLTLTVGVDTPTGVIVVNSPHGAATSATSFRMPLPTIRNFTPYAGAVQRLITVTGSYFSGATGVRFNGVAAPGFRVLSPTELTVLVPTGATNGPLSITTPSGTTTSNTSFAFLPTATGLQPGRNAQNVPPSAPLTMEFSQPVGTFAANKLRIFSSQQQGKLTGMLTGVGTSSLRFAPTLAFKPGEQISVTLPTELLGMQGAISSKQVYQFRVATGGTGRGAFTGNQNLPSWGAVQMIRLGDMNGDGQLDIVTVDINRIGVSLSKGNNTFAPPIYTLLDNFYPALQLGDFDLDGDLDVVTLYNSGSLAVRLNDGTGMLSTGQTLYQVPVGIGYDEVAFEAGDIDGDGDLDVVTGSFNSSTITALLNDGTGNFRIDKQQKVNNYFTLIRLGDVDNDGDLDVVAVNEQAQAIGENKLVVCLNDGNGQFTGASNLTLDVFPTKLQLGDMDGDGNLDVVITGSTPRAAALDQYSVTTLRNDGTGRFAIGPRQLLTGRGATAYEIELGDVDADGDLDVLTAGIEVISPEQVIMLFLNDGKAALTGSKAVISNHSPACMALGDLDNDGDLDLAFDNDKIGLRFNDSAIPLSATPRNSGTSSITLYPNPAHQQFTLRLPVGLLTRAGTLVLVNNLGQTIHQQDLPAIPAGGDWVVKVPSATAGMYWIRLTIGDEQQTIGRIMLQ
ncbi:FG-GAP-like repeat-containing protein [Hymenobacter aerilatus]|uniref:FG-GAP-like repeat-containing protein n=1 Tax=Hymenobacter aerilatus TaxID=2932251 RepID=A0A8T9SZ40_9BACT|nr:FG-GAP-like repeat-containing protein [Hymenobacter aerilatus]UOR05096.1 FG-GAP-like repeat-containing protein [Hymenobacter aerilatus]